MLASVSRHRAGKGKEEEEDQGGRVRKPIKCLTSLRMPLSTSRGAGEAREGVIGRRDMLKAC